MMTMKNTNNLFSREQVVNKTSEDDLTGGEKKLEQHRFYIERVTWHGSLLLYEQMFRIVFCRLLVYNGSYNTNDWWVY